MVNSIQSQTPQKKNAFHKGISVLGQLQQHELLQGLSSDAIVALSHHAKYEKYTVPTLLNSAYQELSHLRLVVEGYIEIASSNAEGEEACIAVLGPGNWVTWLGCFDERPSPYHFYSSAKCKVVAIPCRHVREAADRHPELYRLAIHMISDRFRLLMRWTTDASILSHERRVAQLLLLIAQLNSESSDPVPTIFYTQDKLAVLARTTRQTLSRSLKVLEKQGLIEVGYKKINLLDAAGLKAFVEDILAPDER
ncbi:Crp/Fnr family transcriptional regulator [Photobacterium atrarenae]|uniref:Crp/Fnr family transcriptional regulator n=1 Tax=Photobacterium atrarenae TaxID=865757 RepID=A0ABY5GMT2_9GAMM|nr:Crp/Fnr family transcriptional regulator [Photobacterium atrarenae]UTV30471.1 Crp/Fnr family transcriptional regulator [Photobacterium atrarenae]